MGLRTLASKLWQCEQICATITSGVHCCVTPEVSAATAVSAVRIGGAAAVAVAHAVATMPRSTAHPVARTAAVLCIRKTKVRTRAILRAALLSAQMSAAVVRGCLPAHAMDARVALPKPV